MNIEILSTAEDDLADGYLFYEEQAPGVGEYFVSTLFAEIASSIFTQAPIESFGDAIECCRKFSPSESSTQSKVRMSRCGLSWIYGEVPLILDDVLNERANKRMQSDL